MSEEEIIEHVEYSLINPCFNDGNSTIINNDDLKGLLDLYNKEKEKNVIDMIKDVEFSNFIKERYISKDKIRELIRDYSTPKEKGMRFMDYDNVELFLIKLQNLLKE